MRAAIYGAGAMGTVLGAYITKAGGDVELVSSDRAHVEELKRHGARVTGETGFTVPVRACLPEDVEGVYDVVVLFTKQTANGEVLPGLLPHLADDGVVCTSQNGLPEEAVARAVGRDRCMGCAVSWGATLAAPGVARLTSSPKRLMFSLGSPYGSCARERDVFSLLSLMGKVTLEENFLGARWAKLAVNAAMSPVSALLHRTFGECARERQSRAVCQALMNECFRVQEAAGVKPGKVDGFDIKRFLGYEGKVKKRISSALIPVAMRNHAAIMSGMYFDIARGRRCEVDYINGAVVETAERAGVRAPVNEGVVEFVHEAERGERPLGPENMGDLLALLWE